MLVAGLATVCIVVASPVAHLDHHSLTLRLRAAASSLMVVAAPLILLKPRHLAIAEASSSGKAPCWLAGNVPVIWHVPKLFELPLEAPLACAVEYASLIAGLCSDPVIHLPTTRQWTLPLYLFLATLPCDALVSFLAFCGHVVYQPSCVGRGCSFSRRRPGDGWSASWFR
jgi:hypothetical protein